MSVEGSSPVLRLERPSDEDIIRLTSEGLGQVPTPLFEESAIEVIDRCEQIVTAYSEADSDPIGYIGFSVINLASGRLCYLSTAMVERSHQAKGIAAVLTHGALQHTNPEYVGLKTQSARTYAAAVKGLDRIQPDIVDGVVDEEILQVGVELAEARGGEFPIHRGSYNGHPLYAERQPHPRYPQFYDIIDFEAGDAMFCVGVPPNL